MNLQTLNYINSTEELYFVGLDRGATRPYSEIHIIDSINLDQSIVNLYKQDNPDEKTSIKFSEIIDLYTSYNLKIDNTQIGYYVASSDDTEIVVDKIRSAIDLSHVGKPFTVKLSMFNTIRHHFNLSKCDGLWQSPQLVIHEFDNKTPSYADICLCVKKYLYGIGYCPAETNDYLEIKIPPTFKKPILDLRDKIEGSPISQNKQFGTIATIGSIGSIQTIWNTSTNKILLQVQWVKHYK